MKMICPQCGVKGTAQSSLMGKRVKCPKCLSIFEVSPEVLQAIPIEDIELEQIYEESHSDLLIAGEEEVGVNEVSEEDVEDVFRKLLADEPETDSETEGYESLAEDEPVPAQEEMVELEEEDLQEVPAARAWTSREDTDETLTVIEDRGEEAEDLDAEVEVEEDLLLDEEENLVTDDENILLDDNEDEALDDEDILLDDDEDSALETEDLIPEEEDMTLDDEDLSFEDEDPASVGADDEILSAEDEDGDEYIELDEETVAQVTDVDEEAEIDELSADDLDEDDLDEVEEVELDDEDGVVVHKCSACDEYVDPQSKYEYEGNVYCAKCVPTELKKEMRDAEVAVAAKSIAAAAAASAEIDAEPGRFTLGTLLKDAWHYSKGVKGSIWAALFIMYFILIGIGIGIALGVPRLVQQGDQLSLMLAESGLQLIVSFISFVLMAGIILIAVNKIGQKPYSWKTVFSGFKRFGALLVLFILQAIMLIIGFALFILPGIYLSVGYVLAIPLLLVRKLSPWQALEESRKAIHKRWWTVFLSFIVMSILTTISSIPLGLGLIWTVPMFIVLIGVLYYHFFGAEES